MVWFQCDDCGDSVKKPKVQAHFGQCAARSFTCIDCSRHFDRNTYKSHNTCVTEHEKYAKGATKPGGHAANGFFSSDAAGAATANPAADGGDAVIGAAYLSSRPPWKCSICNVSATSQETLQGHAAGMKHKRRVKAIEKAAQPAQGNAAKVPSDATAGHGAEAGGGTEAEAATEAEGTAAAAAAAAAAANGPASNGSPVAALKRKRAEAANTVSEPANGAAAPSEQHRADKPRKKSKAKAAGSDAAADEVATNTDGVASPGTMEFAKKRKKVLEPTADAAGELAARVGGQQPGKKARRKSKEEAQPADAAGGTATGQPDAAVTAVASVRVGSQTPEQNGESRRLKAGAAGSQKHDEATDSGEAPTLASAVTTVYGSAARIQQSIEQHEAALQPMTAAELIPSKAELRKLRKENKAAQAAVHAIEGGALGEWEEAAVQRLQKLGTGGELAVKALQKDLVKIARKAMQEQWKRSPQLVIDQGKMKLADGVQQSQ